MTQTSSSEKAQRRIQQEQEGTLESLGGIDHTEVFLGIELTHD